MHQEVHSAVLDEEKEHHIYNSIYIWFLKRKPRQQPKREKKKYFKDSFPFLNVQSNVWNFILFF